MSHYAFLTFYIISILIFLPFDIMSQSAFLTFNIISIQHFLIFDVLSFRCFYHSTFCLSTFCPIRYFVLQRFLPVGVFFTFVRHFVGEPVAEGLICWTDAKTRRQFQDWLVFNGDVLLYITLKREWRAHHQENYSGLQCVALRRVLVDRCLRPADKEQVWYKFNVDRVWDYI
jgi:hypothetical protein